MLSQINSLEMTKRSSFTHFQLFLRGCLAWCNQDLQISGFSEACNGRSSPWGCSMVRCGPEPRSFGGDKMGKKPMVTYGEPWQKKWVQKNLRTGNCWLWIDLYIFFRWWFSPVFLWLFVCSQVKKQLSLHKKMDLQPLTGSMWSIVAQSPKYPTPILN